MEFDAEGKRALKKIIAPMGREELKLIKFYIGLLDKVDDEDSWYVFRRLISESAHHLTLDTEMVVRLAPGPRAKGKASKRGLELLLRELDKAERLELEAKKMYEDALPEMRDHYMYGTVAWIRDQEVVHARMVRELKGIAKVKLEKM